MQDVNVDFCGILKLLTALKNADFPQELLREIAIQIKAQTGATIYNSFQISDQIGGSFIEKRVVCCVAVRR